jgi:hypothetical protein
MNEETQAANELKGGQADFTDVKDHALQLVTNYADRDTMLDEIRRMFHMEWDDPPTADWIKATMSPSAYNAAMGAIRLLTATEPQISVPFDESDADAESKSENVEQAAKAMWNGSGRISQRAKHYDIVFSMILMAESAGAVSRTADLLKVAKATEDKRLIRRMEHVANETPYLFDIYNARVCYGDFDSMGLRGLLRKTQTTWGDVQDTYGSLAAHCFGSTKRRLEKVTLNDWYDWGYRVVWLDEADSVPIINNDHELDFLPVQCWIGEGTQLWNEPDRQRYPLLRAMWKSGLWKRENLAMTFIYSLINALGSNPLLVQEVDDPASSDPLVIDRTVPGGVMRVRKGEGPKPLAEKVVDPTQWQGLEMAQQMNEQSTISRQTLGEPPKGASNMAYSSLSLLAQSGRLPLVPPKESGGQMIGGLLGVAMKWFKKDGGKKKLYNGGKFVELSPSDVPERMVFKVILEPDLPQDKMQLAQVMDMLTEKGHVSERWGRENILQIGQSRQMDREIYKEKRRMVEVQKMFDEL